MNIDTLEQLRALYSAASQPRRGWHDGRLAPGW